MPGTKRKFKDEYIQYGSNALESEGSQFPFCLNCKTALSKQALVPNKLKRHLESKHPSFKEKSVRFFENLAVQQNKQGKKLSMFIPEKGLQAIKSLTCSQNKRKHIQKPKQSSHQH